MAVTPFHRSPGEWDAFVRGEQRARENAGLPGQGLPRAFAPPIAQPSGLASRPGPGVGTPPPAIPPPPPPVRSAPPPPPLRGGVPMEAPPAERNKTWQYADAILSGLAGKGSYDQARYDAMDERQSAERLKAALADPMSPASVSMKKRLGPTLIGLGMRPEELEALSGADLQEISGKGDLIAGTLDLRSKAATAKQKAAADEAALKERREYEEAQKKADREYSEGVEAAKDKRELEQEGVRDTRDFGQAKTIAAITAGATAGRQAEAFTEAERARIEADKRKEEHEKKKETRQRAAEVEKDFRSEEISLESLEGKLTKYIAANGADAALPGQENIAARGFYEAKGQILGGTGRSPESSALATDLDNAGAATYKVTNGVANTEADQKRAAGIFRGNGTAASALQRVRERKAKVQEEKKRGTRMHILNQPTISDDPDEANLGTSYE